MPRLDGVHQAEVADEPGEGLALGVAAALDVEGCRRHVDARRYARPSVGGAVVDPVEPLQPDTGLGRRLLQFLLLLPGRVAVSPILPGPRPDILGQVRARRRRPPAVVPLVVQDHDGQVVVQVAQHPAGQGLGCLRPLVHDGVALVAFLVLRLGGEAVPVLHEHLAPLEQRAVVHRHEVEGGVVVVRVVGPEHLEPLLDRQVGAADQHGVGELPAGPVHAPVAERPRDEHRHHDRLARTGRHLAAHPPQREQAIIGGAVDQRGEEGLGGEVRQGRTLTTDEPGEVVVGKGKGLEPGARRLAGDAKFGQVDDRLHGFPLAEEEPPGPLGAAPMVEQFLRDVRRPPVVGLTPAAHVVPQQVHQWEVVPLLLGEQFQLRRAGALRLVPVARRCAACPPWTPGRSACRTTSGRPALCTGSR